MKGLYRSLGSWLPGLLVMSVAASFATAAEEEGKLRIICFGAHPDDAEFQVGGTAAKWAELGHKVKLVSMTNGDIGHWGMAGGPLAQRRTAEVKQAARILGVVTEVLDIHDGELMPTLENRKKVARLIRQWQADIVMAHRPNDYHPDHRNTGILIQDAAFMVTVPYFCPDTPPIPRNPVFMYFRDGFKKPYPFQADIAVSIDDVWDKKIKAMDMLVSQVHEGGAGGSPERAGTAVDDPISRLQQAESRRGPGYVRIADENRDELIKWYGPEKGKAVKRAEVFELCEYGRRPTEAELRKLFPFFPDE